MIMNKLRPMTKSMMVDFLYEIDDEWFDEMNICNFMCSDADVSIWVVINDGTHEEQSNMNNLDNKLFWRTYRCSLVRLIL